MRKSSAIINLMRNYINKFNCIQSRKISSSCVNDSLTTASKFQDVSSIVEFKGQWPAQEQKLFIDDMKVVEDFLSEDEEKKFLEELEPYLKRMRYEFDHWDDAIHGFRETERKHWYPDNKITIQRLIDTSFVGATLPYVHVLDLAEDGHIKPHVDSVRFCGNTIAGLSLLSDSVMRMIKTTESDEITAKDQSSNDYSRTKFEKDENAFYADVLLKRRSLYIMKDTARYKFTHEILGKEFSVFQGQPVAKSRRISIICRNEPIAGQT